MIPDKCPHCGSEPAVIDRSGRPWFACGSHGNFKSATCLDREPLFIRVRELEAVVNDPEAPWANWLRGTIWLPSGIGDVRAANERIRELEERVKRLEEAVDRMPSALVTPEDLIAYRDRVALSDDTKRGWYAAKEAKP